MMNLISKKAYSLLFLLINILSFAQTVPPPPENPESGDIGGYPTSPIDGHMLLLFLIAIFIIIFFAARTKQRIIQ